MNKNSYSPYKLTFNKGLLDEFVDATYILTLCKMIINFIDIAFEKSFYLI